MQSMYYGIWDYLNQKEIKIMETSFDYDVTQEPIVFHLSTIELLLSTKNPSDALALYAFYYAKAKWEEERTIEEMDKLALKTMGWDGTHFAITKQILLDIHLIEEENGCNNIYLFPY